MELSITDITSDKLLTEVCEKAKNGFLARKYLCLKSLNGLHEHIEFEKDNYDIVEIRKRIFDRINEKLEIKPKNPKIVASILALSQIKTVISSIVD